MQITPTGKEKKTLQIYKNHKYELNINGFIIFVSDKAIINTHQLELIQKKITDLKIERALSTDNFYLLLRLVVAVQKGAEIEYMTVDDIAQVQGTVNFRSGKKKYSQRSKNKTEKHSQNQADIKEQKKVQQKAENINQNKDENIDEHQGQKQGQEKEKATQNQKNEIQNEHEEKQSEQQQNSDEDKKAQNKTQQNIEDKNESRQVHQQKEQTKEYQNGNEDNPKLCTIHQENSTELNVSGNSSNKANYLQLRRSQQQGQKVKIVQFEKVTTDYINTFIKYKIQFQDGAVFRRYSQFEKLMNFISKKYQGFILPELPPKEGLKGGISYFMGVDTVFLEERKKKLEQLLNRLLETKTVKQDPILLEFLTNENFEIEAEAESYGAYLKTLTDIAFNAKQLKDYGVAYYNYLRDRGNIKMNKQIQIKYQKVQEIIRIFLSFNEYRKKINKNFDRRRQTRYNQHLACRKAEGSEFDRNMDAIEEEIRSLASQIEKYKKLKSQQSWNEQLIRQKQETGERQLEELRVDLKKTEDRIAKMEKNLLETLEEFEQTKKEQLLRIDKKMVEWRVRVHP